MERWRLEPAAALLLAALAVVWSWWAAKDGAFFGTVLLPGTMLLCATTVVLAWAAPWRASLRRSRPATIALAALAALGVWAALSAIWSPAPDVAIETAQRILTYALAFGLGIWLTALLGSRLHLALVPLAVAGAFAGIVAVVGMLTGDHAVRHYLELDGTLQFPLGYRNANAAFFAIALWPALGLASRRAGAWPVRAAALGTATLCLDLAMLSQSRGSLPAGAVALCVYLLFATDRARRLAWLALAALPALLILPSLVDLYHAGSGDAPLSSALDELRAAGRAVALTSLLSLAIGTVAALGANASRPPSGGSRSPTGPPWWGWWRRCSPARSPSSSSPAIRSTGSTSAFRSCRADTTPTWPGQSSRFVTLNAATQRPGIWRVALLDARHHPLLGDGGGGFRYTYLTERHPDTPTAVQDAHSVELENLAQFGFPGLILFAGAIGAAGVGAMRARRLGPEPAWLSIIALTAGAYWLMHASVDWFWPYPAITAPVLALLGSACAPALRIVGDAPRGQGRLWLAAGAVVLAISAVPSFLSERYVNAAYGEWQSDPSGANDDLDRARTFNPLSIEPLLAEGAIARAEGQRRRAIHAYRRAADMRPEEWASYYNLAELYARKSPRLARRQLAIAKQRNPYDLQVIDLERKFAAERRGSGG